MDQTETLLKFPCEFPIKTMGRCSSCLEVKALEIVRRHVTDFNTENMRSVASRKGNYISITFTIRATSQEQLDAIYQDLTACEESLMAL